MYIHTLGGCHRWVSMKLKFVLKKIKQCLVQCFFTNLGTVAKASFNMHACVWPNDFAHYWFRGGWTRSRESPGIPISV